MNLDVLSDDMNKPEFLNEDALNDARLILNHTIIHKILISCAAFALITALMLDGKKKFDSRSC